MPSNNAAIGVRGVVGTLARGEKDHRRAHYPPGQPKGFVAQEHNIVSDRQFDRLTCYQMLNLATGTSMSMP